MSTRRECEKFRARCGYATQKSSQNKSEWDVRWNECGNKFGFWLFKVTLLSMKFNQFITLNTVQYNQFLNKLFFFSLMELEAQTKRQWPAPDAFANAALFIWGSDHREFAGTLTRCFDLTRFVALTWPLFVVRGSAHFWSGARLQFARTHGVRYRGSRGSLDPQFLEKMNDFLNLQ